MGEPVHGITATSNRERCWGPKQVKKMTEVKATMRQRARAIGIATAIALLTAAIAGTGTSVAAKAPAEFYGVVPQTHLTANDFERMGTGKVGSVRLIMNWAAIDPTQQGDYDWSSFDPLVLEAAANGIQVLPFVYGTPAWVASGIDNQNCNGSKCGAYAPKGSAALAEWSTFLTAAVERYGPDGEFWATHPEVPKEPIVDWQLWNEQNSKTFFAPKPSAKAYVKLLKAGHDAIAQADPGADVILGGMAELAGSRKAIPGSEYLEQLYNVRGVKNYFEAVALHPYGATIAKVSSQVESYRKVIKQAGDSGAGMYVTEVGAGSASGGNSLNRGTKGQASLLKEIYKYFTKKRRSFNVEQVDWFSWQDSAQSICSWCASSGLLTESGKAKPSYKAFTKLTGGNSGKH